MTGDVTITISISMMISVVTDMSIIVGVGALGIDSTVMGVGIITGGGGGGGGGGRRRPAPPRIG